MSKMERFAEEAEDSFVNEKEAHTEAHKVFTAEDHDSKTTPTKAKLMFTGTTTPSSPEPQSLNYEETSEAEDSEIWKPDSDGERSIEPVHSGLEEYVQEVQNLIDETLLDAKSENRSTDEQETQKFDHIRASDLDDEDMDVDDQNDKSSDDMGFIKDLIERSDGPPSSGRYYQEPKRVEKSKCYKCGKIGHIARACPRSLENMCYICGSRNHGSNYCQNERCDRCLQYGHDESECGKKRVKLTFCMRCGSRDHYAVDCDGRSVEKKNMGLRCMSCYEIGHLNCAGPGRAKTVTWCCNCGSRDHVKSNCRNLAMSAEDIARGLHSGRQAGGRFYPFQSCYHCASLRHQTENCVKARMSYGRPKHARWKQNRRWMKGNKGWKHDSKDHKVFTECGKEWNKTRKGRVYSNGRGRGARRGSRKRSFSKTHK